MRNALDRWKEVPFSEIVWSIGASCVIAATIFGTLPTVIWSINEGRGDSLLFSFVYVPIYLATIILFVGPIAWIIGGLSMILVGWGTWQSVLTGVIASAIVINYPIFDVPPDIEGYELIIFSVSFLLGWQVVRWRSDRRKRSAA